MARRDHYIELETESWMIVMDWGPTRAHMLVLQLAEKNGIDCCIPWGVEAGPGAFAAEETLPPAPEAC